MKNNEIKNHIHLLNLGFKNGLLTHQTPSTSQDTSRIKNKILDSRMDNQRIKVQK